mgnify:CR=1 FL=1
MRGLIKIPLCAACRAASGDQHKVKLGIYTLNGKTYCEAHWPRAASDSFNARIAMLRTTMRIK